MEKKDYSRRNFLKTGIVIGLFLTIGLLPQASWSGAKTLTVNSYGGIYEKAVRENYVGCFTSKTNMPVEIMVGIPSAALAKVRATRGKPAVDVFIATANTTITAIDQGLVEKIDPSKLPNLKDLPKVYYEQWDNYAVSFSYGVGGLMYNKEKISDPPKSWKEFVDRTIKGDFGKNVTIPSMSFAAGPALTIWSILNAFGGSTDNPDIAFEKIKAMQPYIPKFYSDASEVVNMMATGEVDIAIYIDGRTWAFHDKGNPWVGWIVPDPGGIFLSSQAMKIKNSAPEAWEFINCLLDPKAQAGFASMTQYPVTNPKVVYPDKLMDRMPKLEGLLFPPQRELVKQAPKWVERWNKEIGG